MGSAISNSGTGNASASSPGLVSTGSQTFAGVKTFQDGATVPTGKVLTAETIQAVDGDGVTIKDDAGTASLVVADGGVVTIGPAAGIGNTSHTIYGGNSTFGLRYKSAGVSDIFNIYNGHGTDATGSLRITAELSSYGARIDLHSNGHATLASKGEFYSDNTLVGSWSQAGAWTWGPSSGLTAYHIMQNSSAAGAEIVRLKKLAVAKNSNSNYYMQFDGSDGADGYLQTNGSAVLSVVDVSDARTKENIRNATYGLHTILALRPVEFDWKSGIKNVKGFIAQEVKDILPESVMIKDESENGGYADSHFLETQTMIPVTVKAIQELAAQAAELSAKNEALEARLAALEARLAALEAK